MKFRLTTSILLSVLIFQLNALNYHFFVGTYTKNTSSEGIYIVRCNPNKKLSSAILVIKNIENPSYVAYNAEKKTLYSVSENENKCSVSAYTFTDNAMTNSYLTQVVIPGKGPCYISYSDYHVFTANYKSGDINVIDLNQEGAVADVVQQIQHTGKSIHPERQSEAHVHQVIFTPDKKYLLANDLGTDYTYSYEYKPAGINEVLIPEDSILLQEGGGPRHLAFSPDGKYIYVVQELTGEVWVLGIQNGHFRRIFKSSVITRDLGTASGADIHTSPDGRFLYVSNRGNYNNISVFRILSDQKLKLISQHSSGGETPRNFTITGDGKYLLAGNQKSNQISVFRILNNGKLKDTHLKVEVPSPVCILEFK